VLFFARRNTLAVVLLKKMQLGVMGLGDYSTALKYGPSHVTRRIRDDEEKPIFLRHPFYEESARY
jgi:hypothetical protein